MRHPEARGPRGRLRCEVVPGSPRLVVSSPSALFPPGTPGVIARVAEHPRKPGRYSVRLVDGRKWLVDADAISASGAVREGVALEQDAIVRLEASHAWVACFDRALGMLARARRTRREIEQRLGRIEADRDTVATVVERLQTLGLLDDEAVARAEAASRFRRGDGAGRIRQSLARKGVARHVIDSAIREVAEEEQIDSAALCRATAEKRLRSLQSHPPEVQTRRLMGFLLRRGFAGGQVHEVVRSLIPRHSRHDE
jgi:regulatory protein